jgi:hypothetical protein
MKAGVSLHIGLNRVDPDHYGGWDGRLCACEYDARDMEAIARTRGFAAELLLTRSATARRVTARIRAAARMLRRGDIFLLSYSGHGGQVPDRSGDEEGDARDETWILYDRELLDDELYALWRAFRPGVRIVVLSDSCHSGTVTRHPLLRGPGARKLRPRVIPDEVQEHTLRRHRTLYAAVRRRVAGARRTAPGAAVLLLSGCQDNQQSADGDRNGLFTATLLDVWNNGAFRGSYRGLHRAILRRMPPSQSPNLFLTGASDLRLDREHPFTVAP